MTAPDPTPDTGSPVTVAGQGTTMTLSDPILDLLARWNELREAGHLATAEELCPDDAGLQARLREKIARHQRFEQLLDPDETLPSPPPASSGLRVAGCEVLELLGRGGMGMVYRARQPALGRNVAIKTIASGADASETERRRFRHEAEAAAQLQHPGIVQVFEVGEEDNCHYLVMELVSGGSLAKRLDGTPLTDRRAAELLRDVALAVAAAHGKGVVHRDLKPANILLTEDGCPKVTDFGLAKRLGATHAETLSGSIFGTPSYMAPEQAGGHTNDVGPAADIYGLGAILYELITGRPPFKAATMVDTLDLVRNHDPVPPRTLQPKLSRDLETICLKCLRKDPAQRYASAKDIADDLQRFLDSEPITARSLSPLELLVSEVRRIQVDSSVTRMGNQIWMTAPIPILIHMAIVLGLRNTPHYGAVAAVVSMTTLIVLTTFALVSPQAVYTAMPTPVRRALRSAFAGNLVASLVAMLVVWLMGLPWLACYPIWFVLTAATFFSLTQHAGPLYASAFACLGVAVVVAIVPEWAPLILGTFVTCNMLYQGMLVRWLGKRLGEGSAA